MRKFFNSKESQHKQLVKNRLHNKLRRRRQRKQILEKLNSEIHRVSASSKLAEILSTKV